MRGRQLKGMIYALMAAMAIACSDGGGPTSPEASITGTYLVNASTVTNTCGPGLDEELLVEIDDHFIQVRRDGNNYTIGFDTFITATVSGNSLHATQTLTFDEGTAALTFDFEFTSDGQSFNGTIDVDITAGAESCDIRFNVHGERD